MKYSLLSAFLLVFCAATVAHAQIQLTFSSVSPTCFGYTNGTATVQVSGGTAPYAYLWENGQAGATNFGVGAGTFVVTVTDATNATKTGTVTVAQPTAVEATIAAVGLSCSTQSGTLTGSATGGTAPYTYVWSTGQSGNTASANGAGLYQATATDAQGCADVAVYYVPTPLAVEVQVVNIPCFMACDGVAKAAVTGGVPPYTYLWNTGATTQIVGSLPPGTYTVTVTDVNNCSVVGSNSIYEPPAIVITTAVVSPACGGNSGSVTASASGGTAPYTYLWSNGVTGPTLSNVIAGTYFVQVTDANGCQKSMAVVVPAGAGLDVSLIITKAECPGVNNGVANAIVTPANGVYSYNWSPANSSVSQFNNLAAGTVVSVTVTDVNTGCQGTATAVIGTHNQVKVQVTDTDVACIGSQLGTASALATGGTEPYNYVWNYPNNTQVTAQNISGLGVGAYSVSVTDVRGCTAVGVADIGALSSLTANYEIVPVECVGDSITVKFTDHSTDNSSTIVTWNWNIVWSSGSVQSNLPNPPAIELPGSEQGTVQLTVTSAAGCTATISSPFAVAALPKVKISVASVAFDCENLPIPITVTGSSNYTYVWSPLDGLTFDPDPMNVIADPNQTTMYRLIAGNNFCADTVEVMVVRQAPLTLSVAAPMIIACTPDATLSAMVNTSATQVIWYAPDGTVVGNTASVSVAATVDPRVYTVIAKDALGCTRTDSIVVVSKAVNVALSVPQEVVDCENKPVTINVNGAPAYTYNWTPTNGLDFTGPFSVVADPTQTTTYQLIAANGFCADTASVKVVRTLPIQLTATDQNIVACTPTTALTADINAASNAQIAWATLAGTPVPGGAAVTVPANNTTAYYVVTATDQYNCFETDTVAVTGRAVDINISGNNAITACADISSTVVIVNNDPIDELSFVWTSNSPNLTVTPNDAMATIVGTAPGTYMVSVLVTNQFNCQQTVMIPVTIQESGSLTGQIQFDLCKGKTVTFTNNSTITGTWSFGDGTFSPLNDPVHTYLAAGNYNITFTPDNADCVAPFSQPITVQPDAAVQAAIAAQTQDCAAIATVQFNDGTTHSAALQSWAWSFTGGTPTSSTQQNPTITFSQQGMVTATLVVTDVNGCTSSASMPVPINIIDEAVAEQQKFCAGTGSVNLNPDFNQTYTYQWSAQPSDPTLNVNDPNPSVSPTVPTAYSVSISNGACTLVYATNVTPSAAPTVSLPGNQQVCSAVPVTVTAQSTNANSFEWSQSPLFTNVFDTDATATISPVQSGVYYVRVTTADGCTAQDTIQISNVAVNIAPEPYDQHLCSGTSTQLQVTNLNGTDQLSYVWTPNLPNSPSQNVTPTANTAYQVVVSNQFGCNDTINFNITVTTVAVTAEVIGSDTLTPGQVATLAATGTGTGNVIDYSWSPAATLTGANTANPTANPKETTVYVVTATDENNCQAVDSVTIYFRDLQCVEPYIFVPKAFTPNNDGNNDLFRVRGVNLTKVHFIVWDRWGEKVYETFDVDASGWDGTFRGKELTPDAYAWYLTVVCGNGETYTSKGDVTLLK